MEPISERTSPGSFATPPLGSQQHRASLSPQTRHGSLLGSPAPIGAVPLPDAQDQQQQRPSLRTTKSGGLLGLLRSVGGSQAAGSRKASQSFDTANESFGDAGLGSSEPPTPVSKDSPEQHDDDAVTAPILPALTSIQASLASRTPSSPGRKRTQGTHAIGFVGDGDHGGGCE